MVLCQSKLLLPRLPELSHLVSCRIVPYREYRVSPLQLMQAVSPHISCLSSTVYCCWHVTRPIAQPRRRMCRTLPLSA